MYEIKESHPNSATVENNLLQFATIMLYKRGKLTYLKQKIEGQCVGITKPQWGVCRYVK